jgi:hypothetical protein
LRGAQFKQSKQLFGSRTTGFAQRQNKRNDKAEDKKRVNLESLRSYGPGEALDPPFLSSFAVDDLVHDLVDEPDAAPIQSGEIPANVAPAYSAYSYPREDASFSDIDSTPGCEDDSFSDIDSSVPMSTFIRSLADQAEAMEQEVNEDDESVARSIRTTDMSL